MSRTFTLGRYTCVERLGNSLLGDLWRAKRFGLAGVERQLLLTKLGAGFATDTQTAGRIQAALKVYAELEHPSFLRLLDQSQSQGPGTAGSDFFWAYEFVGFANLARLRAGLELQGGEAAAAALLPTVAAQIGLTLAMALGTAHERGVAHGLLTPQAVWVDAHGQPRIGDLGLAAALPRAALSSDPQVKAAEKFLAPEILAGQPITPASDVYGLGALLLELLGNAASRVSGEAARRVQSLESIARRAQAKSPSERYASMRDLQQALALAGGSQTGAAREALIRVGQQFLLAGDTVPQPVTISERSSAEPLPPPPTGKISIGKASAATAASRTGTAQGTKPEPGKKSGKDGPSAAGVAPPAAASKVDPRAGQEDTPLPASRPLLMNTDPRLRAANPAAPEPAAPEPARPNRPSGPQRVGSGMEWLTSSAETAAQAGSASGPNKRGSKPNPVVGGAAKGAEKRTSADVPAVDDNAVSIRSTQPGMPQKRTPGPVSINPRARFGAAPKPAPPARVTPNDGGGTWQPASANTPTADVEPPPEELEWKSEDAADVLSSTVRPGEYATLGAASEPSVSEVDLLSMGETRPAMDPVRVPTPRRGMPPADARIGDEPTNQVSVDAALLAQAARSSTAVAAEPPSVPPEPPGPLYSAARPLPPGIDPNQSSSESYVLRSTGLQDQISGEPSVVTPPPPEPEPELDAPLRPQSNRWLGLVAVASLAAIVTVLIAYKFLIPGSGGKDTGSLADGGPGDGGAAKLALPAVSPNELPLTTKPVATVFVDGKERGTAPTTLKLTPGPHKLLLVSEGYKVLRRDITAGAPLSITLEKAVLPAAASGDGVLKVKCKTKGTLRISFDGHDTGKTCPSQVEGVAPGKHTVGFLDPATDELREKAVRVKKGGKETKVSVKF